jgi:cellulose synthase/poly-beta-1,6-N-acetylglucosamine synthase-like glycosyltransferase
MWIAACLIIVAVVFYIMGKVWESNTKRPEIDRNNLPLVSILVANYRNDKIERTLRSIASIDYPKKEIIVVNEVPDKTPEICKKYGIKCIQNEKRMGKAMSLNKAAKIAKGDLLFFVDADTEPSKDCLWKMVPWFKDKKIGVVTPKNTTRNKNKNLLTNLSSFDGYFIANLLKTHMFFGSLLSFRGCSVLVRRDVFEKVGGFYNTMTEDIDFSAKVLRAGYKIHFEPNALTRTDSPETISSLKKQRYRWGKGAMFSFMRHCDFYVKNPQFLVYSLPYIFFPIALFGFFVLNTYLYIIPFLSLYIIYTLSLKEFTIFVTTLIIPLLPTLTAKLTATGTAGMAHMLIVTYPEKENIKDILYIFPYLLFYVPLITIYYAKGVVSAVIDKIKGRPELDLNEW